MTRGVKVRLILFVVLAATGIVYVSASYLGLVDKILGRGVHVAVILPDSGGLYEGGEVDYRGVKMGRIDKATVLPHGVRFDLTLKADTKLPLDSPFYVHNLSAVGEQYIDFEPPSSKGPYAANGSVFRAGPDALPQSEQNLLETLNAFVGSVDRKSLSAVVGELGTAFRGTATPLRRMVDSGTQFVAVAKANEPQTIALFQSGERVLATQQANANNIKTFARDLADLTDTLRTHDTDLRTILQGGGATARELQSLLQGLRPTLPVFLSNLTTVNQVVTARLPGLEQLLVTFPRIVSSGFTGTPGDGYGYINMQMNNSVPPCTKGYKPPSQWRPGSDTTDGPVYPARCLSGAPVNMRGSKHAPGYGSPARAGTTYRVSTYDPRTGLDQSGKVGTVTDGSARHTVFGDHSWEWLLLGPRPMQ